MYNASDMNMYVTQIFIVNKILKPKYVITLEKKKSR